MKHKAILNGVECLSIGFSLIIWVMIALYFFGIDIPLPDAPWYFVFVPWIIGFVFAIIAAVIGSKRWLFAIILPVISIVATIVISGK